MIIIAKMILKDPNYLIGLMAIRGYNERQFAKYIGISNSYLCYILNRRRTPSPQMARKISNGVDKTIPDLFLFKTLSKDSKEDE